MPELDLSLHKCDNSAPRCHPKLIYIAHYYYNTVWLGGAYNWEGTYIQNYTLYYSKLDYEMKIHKCSHITQLSTSPCH